MAQLRYLFLFFFFFQAEDGIRDVAVTGVQTCALPISARHGRVERAACVGDAAAGFFELVEHGGPLRAAEVEAVGDAEREIGRARVGKECRSRWSPYH